MHFEYMEKTSQWDTSLAELQMSKNGNNAESDTTETEAVVEKWKRSTRAGADRFTGTKK